MNSLKSITLGELIEFQRGYDLPKSQFQQGNVPVISSNGILGFHNKAKVKAPGITIGRSGTVGLPHYIKNDFFPHNTSLFIKDFKGNYPKYIFYLLKNLSLDKKKSGSGVPTMNRNHLHPLKILAYLDKDEQIKIALILSLLDKKIELNNQINQKLEAMAKTYYDYWFVQFDFPDANSKPYKSSGGKMVYSEDLKKEIPEGWEVDIIGNTLPTSLGGTPITSNREYWKGDVPWLNSGEIANFPIIDSELKISLEAIEKSATTLMPIGTVVISITRHLRPSILAIESCANQSVVGILESDDLKSSYIYPFIHNEIPRYMTLRTGAQQPHINKKTIDETFMIMPSFDVLGKYYNFANPIYEKINNTAFQNQKLTQLRDWLLPMLMNGQLKVN